MAITESNELRYQERRQHKNIHHSRRGIQHRSPRTTRKPGRRSAVYPRYRSKGQNPRICCNDSPKQCTLLHPCKQSAEGEWLRELTNNHLKSWNPNTNHQISYNDVAFLGICTPRPFHTSNPIELAIDAKRRSRYCNIECGLNMGCCGWRRVNKYSRDNASKGVTDITVHRSPVDRVLVLYDRVDTLQEASKASPEHEQASARISSYNVTLRKNTPIR